MVFMCEKQKGITTIRKSLAAGSFFIPKFEERKAKGNAVTEENRRIHHA